VVTLEKERIVRWTINNKENWVREEEIEEDSRKIEEMVPEKFLNQNKVFGKVESERIPTRKVWDHAIDLKEIFKPQKRRIYPLSKNEREEVQNFMKDQLRKGYIRPSKSPQMLSCQTAIQAIKVIFFTIITRITSLREKFSPLEISLDA